MGLLLALAIAPFGALHATWNILEGLLVGRIRFPFTRTASRLVSSDDFGLFALCVAGWAVMFVVWVGVAFAAWNLLKRKECA